MREWAGLREVGMNATLNTQHSTLNDEVKDDFVARKSCGKGAA
jgi:hypothetical protein